MREQLISDVIINPFQQGFDLANLDQVCELLNVSPKTLYRYRELASKCVPCYDLISEQWWQYRFEESYIESIVWARVRRKNAPKRIDKPPFCRKQIEILQAIAAMLKTGLTETEISNIQSNNPNYWRNYHHVST